MSILQVCGETEDLGRGRFRHTQHMRPIAYKRNGILRPMSYAFGQSGAVDMPVGVDEAMLVRFAATLAAEKPVLEVRPANRSKGIRLSLLNANDVGAKKLNNHEYVYRDALNGADLALVYAGHYVAADLRLKAGHPSIVSWRMDAQAGFDPKTMTLGDMTIREPVLLPPERDMDKGSVELKWAVSQESGRYRLDCVLPRGDWRGWTLDPTLTLQPDAAAGKDTFHYESTPDSAIGTGTELWPYQAGAWRRPILLQFSLAALPAGATVSAATLTLADSGAWFIGAGTLQVNFYSILAANNGWIENCTWNFADGAGASDRWAGDAASNGGTDAGCSVSGTDYNGASIGNIVLTQGNPAGTTYDAAISAAAVQGWATANYGMIGFVAETSKAPRLASSDHATAAYRPKLVVDYTTYVPSSHQMSGGLRSLTGGMYE